jgi:hypothetical protein
MKQALLKVALVHSKNHVSRERDCQLSSQVEDVSAGLCLDGLLIVRKQRHTDRHCVKENRAD